MTTDATLPAELADPARSCTPVKWTPSAVLALLQGAYYFATAIWPIISIESFQRVTGPKTDHLVTGQEGDHWLVMTVAVLILVNGLVLLVAGWRRHVTAEVVLLAVGSALGLALIDVIYVERHVLAPIYLADAVGEGILILSWIGVSVYERRPVLNHLEVRA